jgi:hypothetical protein
MRTAGIDQGLAARIWIHSVPSRSDPSRFVFGKPSAPHSATPVTPELLNSAAVQLSLPAYILAMVVNSFGWPELNSSGDRP